MNAYVRAPFETKALLLHKSAHAFDITVHDVLKTEGEYGDEFQMGAGRVLGIEEKNEIAATITDTCSASLTLFDEHILAATTYAIAWWIPAAKRTVSFRLESGMTKTLTFDFPSQVAVFSRGTLYFASLKTKKARPKANTPLYNSPLPNLYGLGRFCTGTATNKIPDTASVDNIPLFERFLFDTVNTHVGRRKPLLDVDNTDDLVETLERENGGFPTDKLVPMSMTLNDWINQIDQNNPRGL